MNHATKHPKTPSIHIVILNIIYFPGFNISFPNICLKIELKTTTKQVSNHKKKRASPSKIKKELFASCEWDIKCIKYLSSVFAISTHARTSKERFHCIEAEICSLHCLPLSRSMNILVALITCKLDSRPHANIHTHTRDFINFTLRANMQILAEWGKHLEIWGGCKATV